MANHFLLLLVLAQFWAIWFVSCLTSNPNCLYFNPVVNSTDTVELFAPNICTTSRSGSTYSSYQFKCESESEIIGEFYGDTTNCNGKAMNSTSFKKSDGYDFNCNSDAKDCSSLYRIYDSCDTNTADYVEAPVVTGMCLSDKKAKTSSIWTCQTKSLTFTEYIDSTDCSNDATSVPVTYNTGCDYAVYYEILSCNQG